VYYPLMVYGYRLEREGQSMTRESVVKNVYSHEKVCMRLLSEFVAREETVGQSEKEYLIDRIIVPMCRMQYMVTTDWCNSRKPFLSFNKKLREYRGFYSDDKIIGPYVKFHRATRGLFIGLKANFKKVADGSRVLRGAYRLSGAVKKLSGRAFNYIRRRK